MTCESATAPINIVSSQANECKGKCDYSYFYQNTSGSVKNYNQEYILINLQDDSITTFNSKSYQLEEIRLYSPSLHLYGGEKSQGELMIIHKNVNGPDKLIVSIPIILGGNLSQSSNDLKQIIDIVSESENNQTSQLTGMTINLNNFIPKTVYYFYKGTLPFSCGSSVLVNYVVFSKNIRNSPINLQQETLTKINKLIEEQSIDIKPKPNNFGLSKNPPQLSGSSSGGDIYIDCQPVGEDGEILINTSKNSIMGNALSQFKSSDFKVVWIVLISIIILLTIGAFRNSIMNFFGSIFDMIFSYKQKGGNKYR